MGRHRHVANVRADGIAVVLGPLLRDVRIVAAALIDVDSGMVLDAWSAGGPLTGSPDLELIGAQYAEIVRGAVALLRTWAGTGAAAGSCEVVLGADDGCRHLLRTVPDPHGDRLALAVVVDGPLRVLDRVRRRLQAVSVDALTAGPSMTRRPSGSGWSFDPPGPDVPAQPQPGAGLLPPNAAAARPAPEHGPPRPRDGRPVPRPQVPTPRGPFPAAGPAQTAGPAMAGLVPSAPPSAPTPTPPSPAAPPGRSGADVVADEAGRDDARADDAGPDAGIAPVVIPSEPVVAPTRRPMLFSVRPVADAPPAAPRPPSPGPRPPSPPAALPAPAPPRPPRG